MARIANSPAYRRFAFRFTCLAGSKAKFGLAGNMGA